MNDAGAVDLRLVEEGTPVPAQLLSDGTLRILGLLALSAYKYPPTLVGIEEPENGIHPRRIQLIAELLKNRSIGGNTQTIITTHSPILPNILPRECLLLCRKLENGSTIDPFSAWEPVRLTREIKTWLAEDGELSISERILRGDFDAA